MTHFAKVARLANLLPETGMMVVDPHSVEQIVARAHPPDA